MVCIRDNPGGTVEIAVRIVIGAYYIALVIGQIVIARKHRNLKGGKARMRDKHSDAPAFYIMRTLGALQLAVYVFVKDYPLTWLPLPLRALGLAIMLAAAWIILRAQSQLGNNWYGGIAIKHKQELITTGLYSRIRHPLYAGLLLTAPGVALLSADAFAAAGALAFGMSTLPRIFLEEHLLEKYFKRQFPEYKAHTGMLFPRFRNR